MATPQYPRFEGEPLRRAPNLRHVQRYLGVEPSESSEESEGGRGTGAVARPCVWAVALGASVLVGAFLLGFSAPGVLQLRGMGAGRVAQARVSGDFGEKVLVSEPSTAVPSTTESVATAAPEAMTAAPVFATTALPDTADPQSRSPQLSSANNPLLPTEDLHDGNVCGDEEELFAGLCYRKCRLLTNGTDAIRTSPWTCCESHPCTTNQRASVAMQVACAGYAVAGNGACPHKPGSCLADEELFLGVCYKKCSLLTERNYPHRVSPMTCCQGSGLGCLDFRKDYTSKEFAVGGGQSGPGACSEDEELFLGLCYERCSVLTSSEYPHRVSAVTCCKAGSRLPHKVGGVWHLGCLDFRKDKTSMAFNTAARAKQGSSVFERSHYPVKSLTEAGNGAVFLHT